MFGRNHQFDSGLYEDFRVYGVSPGMFYNIQILNCREIFSKEPTIRMHLKIILCRFLQMQKYCMRTSFKMSLKVG